MSANGATSSTAKKIVKVPGTMDQLHLDFNALCKTTGWYNNCGLNCLTHFLYNKLSKLPADGLDLFLVENPEYLSLLETFKEYYSISQEFGWHDLLNLMQSHPAATDQEAIFAPVLRSHLGKVLIEKAEELWSLDASAAISAFRTTGTVADIAAPIYYSNKAFFDSQRAAFEKAFIESLDAEPTALEIQTAINKIKFNTDNMKIQGFEPKEQEVYEHVIFQRKTRLEEHFHDEAHIYWMTQGCQNYAKFVANLYNAVMISADQLQMLSERFNIGVEVYTPDSMRAALLDVNLANETHGAQSLPQRQFYWTMKVLNMGLHWTYQEPDKDLQAMQQHNQYYGAGAGLSKFKINCLQAQSADLIIAEVRCLLGDITEAELSEIKIIAQLARELARKATISPAMVTPFRRDVYTVLNATPAGKEYIALILGNEGLLKLINEQFNAAAMREFMKIYANAIEKVKTFNKPTQAGLFDAFLTKNPHLKVSTSPMVDALEEALASQVGLTITLTADQMKGIKLSLLSIMQTNDHGKALAALIQKFPAVVEAFNLYPEAAIRELANSSKLPDILPKLEKFNATELKMFLDRYVASLQVGKAPVVRPSL